MPETRRKVILPPPIGAVEGVDVPINESIERWSEITLSDGTMIRLKPNVLAVTRIDGQYDNEGNPMYAVMSNQMMTVANVSHGLRKPIIAPGGKTN